jgi:hypothetical protein
MKEGFSDELIEMLTIISKNLICCISLQFTIMLDKGYRV